MFTRSPTQRVAPASPRSPSISLSPLRGRDTKPLQSIWTSRVTCQVLWVLISISLNSRLTVSLSTSRQNISLFLLEPRPRLKLLPNTIDIVADDLLEAKKVNRDLLLRSKLQPVLRNFDIVIIDTPPAMRAATLNGLAVADTTIVPVESSFFLLLGLNQLLQVIAAIRDAHQPNMVLRALTSHFNRRQNLDKQIRRQVEDFFGPDLVLQTPIHKSVGIVEAIMLQKAAIEYSPATSGAFDFNKLTQELIEDIADEQAPFRSALG
ncbi:MAG TPA: ParA family protein [Terriglobia bacterium]|nr:ParA family protein [Terriglobia bacterium]